MIRDTLTAAIFLLVLVCAASAQRVQGDCPHAGDIDRFDDVRVTPPVQITMIDGSTLTYVIVDKDQVAARTLKLSTKTILPPEVWKLDNKKRWWIIWCFHHQVAYDIALYEPPKK